MREAVKLAGVELITDLLVLYPYVFCSPVVGFHKLSGSTTMYVSIQLTQDETVSIWSHPKCSVLVCQENKCRDNNDKKC
jgi:hypothetical protein